MRQSAPANNPLSLIKKLIHIYEILESDVWKSVMNLDGDLYIDAIQAKGFIRELLLALYGRERDFDEIIQRKGDRVFFPDQDFGEDWADELGKDRLDKLDELIRKILTRMTAFSDAFEKGRLTEYFRGMAG
uniref:Uncharacterized protein n=2 Tax=Aureimonas altamirensis TaxID=370622 RepID=A0A0P0YX13_9HYPH|nr:hypothetical protein [Aureimonas altamirensis]